MRKLTLAILCLITIVTSNMAQPVSDNELIPVAVTLNPVLRLNVVSGGNIEFIFNTLADYTNGFVNADHFDTRFTVASSIDFDVRMYAADATFIGTDKATANTMPLGNVCYTMQATGTGVAGTAWNLVGAAVNPSALTVLNATATTEVISGLANAAAGDVAKNAFTINWSCATAACQAVSGLSSLLVQSLSPDRYVTNVHLVLEPRD